MSNPKSSGIDLNLGHKCSRNAFSWAKKSFNNRTQKDGMPVLNIDGAYSNIIKFGDQRIAISSDGIGTKIELAERTGIYETLGFDLVAMIVDDLISIGAEPTNLSNILDADFLDYEIVDQLMKGLCNAASVAQIVVTGGEIAELGSRIGGYGNKMHFNWCATGIGLIPADRHPVDGTSITEGDLVISIKENGFRSNGFSLIRKIMNEKIGDDWHNKLYENEISWGKLILTPSLIYSNIINKILQSKYNIHGICNITGGGIPDNLGRILKLTNSGAQLNDLFETHDFIKQIQSMGKISDDKAYKTWNMGNGMLVVVNKNDADKIVELINMNNGYVSKISGYITKEKGINIVSKGLESGSLLFENTSK